MPKLVQNRRKEIVDHLIGNCDCGAEPQFSEDDIEVLNKFSVDQLERMLADHKQEEDKEPAANKDKAETDKEEKVIANKEDTQEPKQFDESQLPESVREELQFARNMMQQQKDQLIAKITDNEECLFEKDELNNMSVDNLTKMASLVGNASSKEEEDEPKRRTPRLGGHKTPTDNQKKCQVAEILDLPVMDFGS